MPAPRVQPVLETPEPPIATERFSLRLWGSASSDAAALTRAWNDPTIADGTAVPSTPDTATASRWIEGEIERRRRGLALDLVVADPTAPEQVLGEVGVVVADRARGWGELGWWLFPEARGRGIAAGAVELLARHLLAETTLRRLFARIPADNSASQRVAERAGMTEVGRTDDGVHVWVRDRTAT